MKALLLADLAHQLAEGVLDLTHIRQDEQTGQRGAVGEFHPLEDALLGNSAALTGRICGSSQKFCVKSKFRITASISDSQSRR